MPKIDKQLDDFDTGSLHYPDDLGVGFTHPDCVKFTIGSNPGVSLAGVTKVFKAKLGASKAAIGKSIDDSIKKLETQRNALGDKPAKELLEDLNSKINQAKKGRDAFNKREGFNAEDYIGIFKDLGNTLGDAQDAARKADEKNIFTYKNSIYLPMPENLVYNEPIDWQGTDLGAMKSGIDALMGRKTPDDALGGAALSQAGNALAGGAGSIVSKLLGGGLLGGAVLGALGGGDALGSAIESNLRIRSNPFKEQTFQGVGFRPFEFSFVFNARSQSEVNTIRRIINTFRKHSKPSLDKPDSAIFSYPDEFRIEFLTLEAADSNYKANWTDNNYLPKLKQCVCKSVNTNFTTAGWKSFEEGAPTTITLQLGFEETDIITSEQVEIEGDGF